MTRRTLLGGALAVPFLKGAGRLPIKKAVEFNMLPKSLSPLDAFQLAKDAGFEEIECPTTPEQSKAEEMLDASKKTGLRIHSVMNQAHWTYPLSSPDPAAVEKSLEGMRTSLQNAKLWGADTVLLVPAVVNAEVSYAQAWERSQRQIRKLIPIASSRRSSSASRKFGINSCSVHLNSRATSIPLTALISRPISMSATSPSVAIRRIGFACSASGP